MNIGVITVQDDRIAARFLENWDRAREFGGFDVDFLLEFAGSVLGTAEESERSLLFRSHPTADLEALRRMAHTWMGSIQLTEPAPSMLDYRELLDDVAPDYLKEDAADDRPAEVTPRSFRDKRSVISEASYHFREELVRHFRTPAAISLLHQNVPYRGHETTHRFDLALKNGALYVGAFAISYELPDLNTLISQSNQLFWHVSDMRKAQEALPMLVVTYPPRTGSAQYPAANEVYRETIRVCGSFETQVVPAFDLSDVAKEYTSHIPSAALPRSSQQTLFP